MTKWSHIDDPWDPDHPAVRLGREALRLRPVAEPEPAPEADPVAEVARLSTAVRRGDRTAVERLRRLLGRLHGG